MAPIWDVPVLLPTVLKHDNPDFEKNAALFDYFQKFEKLNRSNIRKIISKK